MKKEDVNYIVNVVISEVLILFPLFILLRNSSDFLPFPNFKYFYFLPLNSIMFSVILLILFFLYVHYFFRIRQNVKNKEILDLEKFGKSLSTYSITILTIGVSLVGLTSIATSFLLKENSLLLEGSSILSSLYLVLTFMVICVVRTNQLMWIGRSFSEDKNNKITIQSYYSNASLFVLVEMILLILISIGGFAVFTIPSHYGDGVEIIYVYAGGAAEKAGLEEGMIIISINNATVNSFEDYMKVMRDKLKDEIITIKTERGLLFNVELGERKIDKKGAINLQTKTHVVNKGSLSSFAL